MDAEQNPLELGDVSRSIGGMARVPSRRDVTPPGGGVSPRRESACSHRKVLGADYRAPLGDQDVQVTFLWRDTVPGQNVRSISNCVRHAPCCVQGASRVSGGLEFASRSPSREF